MNIPETGAVLYAKDPKRVASFYEEVAGLSICRTTEKYFMLESGSFQLVVLQIPDRIAKSITIGSPPVRREEGAIKLVFLVESIEKARKTASALGGGLNDVEREWQFDATTVCDGYDPEGNVFQLRQPNDR